MQSRSTQVVCCQLNIIWEDKQRNFDRVRSLLLKRQLEPGSLLLLPEMFATGFSMKAGALGEGSNGVTARFLRELAIEKKIHILGGVIRVDQNGNAFNDAVCFAPSGKHLKRYSKTHLFTPGGESDHYTPGDTPALFPWQGLKVGIHICYDLRFPELFRLSTQRGAGILVVIANWPSRRQSHWTTLLKARAIENQAYVIGVNRCGRDPHHEYSGGSAIIDPHGSVIASAGRSETLISAKLDLAEVHRWRRKFPILKDMRATLAL